MRSAFSMISVFALGTSKVIPSGASNMYVVFETTEDTSNFYIDEVIKYFDGKGYTAKLLPTESVVSYKIYVGW